MGKHVLCVVFSCCVAVLRMEEEASLKAVLEMSKKDAVEGVVKETPPTDNGSGVDLLGLNFGTSGGIDGLDGGLGRVKGVWSGQLCSFLSPDISVCMSIHLGQ